MARYMLAVNKCGTDQKGGLVGWLYWGLTPL